MSSTHENRPAASSAPLEVARAPEPEPSDPDAAMYAAARARPDWITKPGVRAVIEELSRDVGPGEDLFFWDVHKLPPARPSDAHMHVRLAVPDVRSSPAHPSGLETGRVYLGPDARGCCRPQAPRPGRNGRPVAVAPGGAHRALSSWRLHEAHHAWARRGALVLLAGVALLTGVALGERIALLRDAPTSLLGPAAPPVPLDAAPPVASSLAASSRSAGAPRSTTTRPPDNRPDFQD